jgi:hypothetical protein
MVDVIKRQPAIDMGLDEDDGDQHDHGRDGTEEGTKDQKTFAVGHGELPLYCVFRNLIAGEQTKVDKSGCSIVRA